jgi:formate-dependent nitrite reductase cytochrome c552 subunit
VPKITIKLTPHQLAAVQEIMRPEIESTQVRVDTTRKTASFTMDNPLEYLQTLTETYDSPNIPRRVLVNILRKVNAAQQEV